MGIQLKNNASGTLATSINASDTGIVLTTGNGANFPALGASDYFYATLESTGGTFEVIKVTARSGDSMTVVRAQDGSAANSFAAGSRIELRVTAQSVLDAVDQVTAAQVEFTPVGALTATNVQAAIAEVVTDLALSSGSSTVGFLQSGTGAVATNVQAKLRQTVSVKDFGAIGDGVVDDLLAIQAAIDTGRTVYLPRGVYFISGFLLMNNEAQKIFGESRQNSYFTTSSVAGNHDIMRISASKVEVTGIHFRPGMVSNAAPPAYAPIRVYAPWANIHGNQFLSPSAGSGTAILLDDVNPATSGVVAGAYQHTIDNNLIGLSGYEFQYGIFCFSVNNGQQANKVTRNHFMGDIPIYVYYGGGNTYFGNLFQSRTGTFGSPAGNAIDLQASAVGEMVMGNYFERYENCVIARRTTKDYVAAILTANHYDNNTRIYQDALGSLITVYDTDLIRTRLSINEKASLTYTSNGQTQTPPSSFCEITGAGALRTGCFLGNGSYDGQQLRLRGATWGVQILNNPGGVQNVYFDNNAASATFGNLSGNVYAMDFVWDAAFNAWFELGRSTVPNPAPAQLSYTGNGQTKTPTTSFCEITGAGALRTGCFLGNGSYGGQRLTLRGATWGVQILNNPGGSQNIYFNNNAASATFGNLSGNVYAMELIWDATFGSGAWFETGRSVAP
jgi:hypothetical protein